MIALSKMKIVACITWAALAVCGANIALAQSKVTAATPPMGWNSWNHFRNKVDDASVRAQADAMVSTGMRDAGYTYVNIDDTWEGERDAKGNIQTNSKFPDMKALADYVHSKGLKIGIYSSPGSKTCAKFEGSLNHEQQDANTYAAWGIDYLKYDLCGLRDEMKLAPTPEAQHKIMVDAYIKMRDALLATKRPIIYSLCQYGDAPAPRLAISGRAKISQTPNSLLRPPSRDTESSSFASPNSVQSEQQT